MFSDQLDEIRFIQGPEDDAFTVTVVARVPEDKFASWATFQLLSWKELG